MYVTINSPKIMFFVSPPVICLSVHGNYIFVISEREACSSLGSVYILLQCITFTKKKIRVISFNTLNCY